MTFLLDNNLSPRFAKALSALGSDVKALREEFPRDIQDVVLLAHLASKGWVLVSEDRHILTRPMEAAALKQARVTAFFLGPFFGSLKFWDQAVWLVKHWPSFEGVARTIDRGMCFVVKHNGKMNAVSP